MTVESPDHDALLAVQARQGDRRAFTELMGRLKHPLYRFVRRYIGNDDDACDIVQETFIAAWGALRRYDEQRPFATWLRAIALNKCRDHGRRQAVRARLRSFIAMLTPLQQVSVMDEQDAEAERLQKLDSAISALPAFYKEPLLLTAISGLSQKEAAIQLKTTPKAVEMRVRRARQQLHDLLGEDNVDI